MNLYGTGWSKSQMSHILTCCGSLIVYRIHAEIQYEKFSRLWSPYGEIRQGSLTIPTCIKSEENLSTLDIFNGFSYWTLPPFRPDQRFPSWLHQTFLPSRPGWDNCGVAAVQRPKTPTWRSLPSTCGTLRIVQSVQPVVQIHVLTLA